MIHCSWNGCIALLEKVILGKTKWTGESCETFSLFDRFILRFLIILIIYSDNGIKVYIYIYFLFQPNM